MDDSASPELESYAVVLRRGERADTFSDDELETLQSGHLAYMNKLRRGGLLLVNGPFTDQPDATLRGFCLYSCSVEEARALAEADPSVAAGRLQAEAFVWLVPKGTLSFAPARESGRLEV